VSQGFLTNAEYATLKGVSRGCVSQKKANGELVWKEHPTNPRSYLIDVAASDQLAVAISNPIKLKPASKIGHADLEEASKIRLDKARIDRDNAALDLAERLDQLTDLQIVEGRRMQEGRLVRERVTDTLRQHAEQLAAMTDGRAISAFIQTELDKIFTNIANELDDLIAAESEDDGDDDPDDEADA
jgi:hypothetical protein